MPINFTGIDTEPKKTEGIDFSGTEEIDFSGTEDVQPLEELIHTTCLQRNFL